MSSPRLLTLLLALALWLRADALAGDGVEPEVITLERAYDLALASDQSVRIAWLEVRKARLLPWSALTRLGPRLNATGSYSRGESALTRSATESAGSGNGLEPAGSPASVVRTSRSRSGSAGAGLSLQQPLIDFTVFPAYRVGRLSAEVARLQHRFAIRSTLFGVAQAYYAVLEQQRLVEVNRDTLRLAKEQLELSSVRADVGEVTRSDVLRAEVTFQTARRTLVESENLLESRRNTLGNILNFPPDHPYRVTEPPDFPTALSPFADLLQRANAHREDLRVQDLTVRQDIERKNQIVASYAPTVGADFRGDLGNDTGTSRSRQRSWQATVNVEVPIFTGGQREIDLATAQLKIEQTRLDREVLAKSIEQEVKDAWLDVRSFQETLIALRAQVTAAEQSYVDFQNQYRAGAATSVDVLIALTDLNTARSALTRETYNYQVALRNLEQTGGVFQESRIRQLQLR